MSYEEPICKCCGEYCEVEEDDSGEELSDCCGCRVTDMGGLIDEAHDYLSDS
jgi:hypothetical protein